MKPLLLVVAVFPAVFLVVGCCPQPPAQTAEAVLARIESRLNRVTGIANNSQKPPIELAAELRGELRRVLPDQMKDMGVIMLELETIPSDAQMERLVEMGKRLEPAIQRTNEAMAELGKRTDDDPKAGDALTNLARGALAIKHYDALVPLGFKKVQMAPGLCERAFDHIMKLVAESGMGAPIIKGMEAQREKMLGECRHEAPELIRCALAAKTLDEMTKCSAGKDSDEKKSEKLGPEKEDAPSAPDEAPKTEDESK